jgi:hypothetical protein
MTLLPFYTTFMMSLLILDCLLALALHVALTRGIVGLMTALGSLTSCALQYPATVQYHKHTHNVDNQS